MPSKTGAFDRGNGRSTVVSFVATDISRVLREYRSWLPISGYICSEIVQPSPLFLLECITPPNRCAFLETSERWTAYIDNDRIGNWPLSFLFCMAERLRTECVALALAVDSADPTECAFGYWDGRSGSVRSRTIELIRDSQWEFQQRGEPLPFEDVDRYAARRISERFSNNIVLDYASKLQIYLNDRSFFTGNNCAFQLSLRGR
jgi:hypothetical protein